MFPYAERAPKTYKKHFASTVKKDILNDINRIKPRKR